VIILKIRINIWLYFPPIFLPVDNAFRAFFETFNISSFVQIFKGLVRYHSIAPLPPPHQDRECAQVNTADCSFKNALWCEKNKLRTAWFCMLLQQNALFFFVFSPCFASNTVCSTSKQSYCVYPVVAFVLMRPHFFASKYNFLVFIASYLSYQLLDILVF